MCIRVIKEPTDLQLSPYFENCIFCNHQTTLWEEETNRPVCKNCAEKFDPIDIPNAYFNY